MEFISYNFSFLPWDATSIERYDSCIMIFREIINIEDFQVNIV